MTYDWATEVKKAKIERKVRAVFRAIIIPAIILTASFILGIALARIWGQGRLPAVAIFSKWFHTTME